ncbi:MBL fold metallo-hydrolase [Janibacter sp. GXQ6167]|uniref:MBL fold metallo-hydrolase n=1 Tax=Janibacter sp. GXQ6167 TaxID=3240791 RepID=UPI0035247494
MTPFPTPGISWSDHSGSPQFRAGRFRNAREQQPVARTESGLKLGWDFLFNKPATTTPDGPLPLHRLTRAELDATPAPSLYRLGHSSVLIRLRSGWWLTDPVFSLRASPVQFAGPKRFHPVPITAAELPPLAGIVLSHDHYDHLDKATITELAPKTGVFLTPLGVGDRLIDWGVPRAQVRQLDWWEEAEVDGVRLIATPAQHFSGRTLSDSNRTLWASWVIDEGDLRLFFSGDTGYHDGFAEIGRRLGPFDLTMMETGAYSDNWPFVHMHPRETVQAHLDLGGRWLLPIHNGTFDLAMHPWDDPFEQVLAYAAPHDIEVTTPVFGDRLDLTAPHPGERWWRTVGTSTAETAGDRR